MDDLDFERGHRNLKIWGKGGGNGVIIPLAPRTSRALDYIDERSSGPIFPGAIMGDVLGSKL